VPRVGDGEGLARAWLDAGAYYAALNPDLFQMPVEEGLATTIEDWALHATSDDALVLVAEQDGVAVGYIWATIEQPSPVAAANFVRDLGLVRVVIQALVVQEAYRRQGVGTRLMQAAEAWARGKGAAVALLDTYVGSPLSVPFYEEFMGYSRRALRFRKELV
jgi:GNAT superfamily N-acetyltransferase